MPLGNHSRMTPLFRFLRPQQRPGPNKIRVNFVKFVSRNCMDTA